MSLGFIILCLGIFVVFYLEAIQTLEFPRDLNLNNLNQFKNVKCVSLCSNDFSPICANDEKTYHNPCVFKCATELQDNLEKVQDGHCSSKNISSRSSTHKNGQKHCYCTHSGTSVCGTDGETYKSLCHLKCAHKLDRSIKLHSHSACEESTENPVPIREIKSKSESKHRTGTGTESRKDISTPKPTVIPAENDDDEDCVCPRIYSPVCGTNGVNYANMCELNCTSAKNSSVILAYRGRCRTPGEVKQQKIEKPVPVPNPKEDCVCQKDLPEKKVCGSNGITLENECEFNCAKLKDLNLYMVNEGTCRTRPQSSDDDGTLADHKADERSCKCTPSDLPDDDNEPVCSGHGVTYMSKCALKCENRIDPTVRLVFCGPCNKTHKCKRGGHRNGRSDIEMEEEMLRISSRKNEAF